MAKIILRYRDINFELEEYKYIEENGVLMFDVFYKGQEFKAKDLPALRGLLSKVFDKELGEGLGKH